MSKRIETRRSWPGWMPVGALILASVCVLCVPGLCYRLTEYNVHAIAMPWEAPQKCLTLFPCADPQPGAITANVPGVVDACVPCTEFCYRFSFFAADLDYYWDLDADDDGMDCDYDWFNWYGNGVNVTTSGLPGTVTVTKVGYGEWTGETVTITGAGTIAPGTYTGTVTVDDLNNCSQDDDSAVVYNVTVRIKPPAPTCTNQDAPSVGCGDGGGGCSGCGGNDCFPPSPDIREPKVWVMPCSDWMGPAAGNTISGTDGCTKDTIKVVDSCQGWKAVYRNPCGACCVFALPSPPEQGQQPTSFGPTSCNGFSISGTIGADGATTFIATGPDGSTSSFSVGPPGSNFETPALGPVEVTDPGNNNVVIYDRDPDGTLNSATLPNGDTWTYEHTLGTGDTRITKATAPDGTYADITYWGTGENGAGKLKSVTRKSATGTVLSEITYTYDGSSRLISAEKGSKLVTYSYPDGQTVEVCERWAANPSTVYSRTVYSYAASTTTVTRKKQLTAPPSGPDTDPDDQETTYGFYLSDGRKTYIGMVTDPDGQTTTYDVDTSTGRTNYVEDSLGLRTTYTYNSKGAVTQVTRTGGSYQSVEYFTYYTSGGADTVWLKTHQDAMGNWTYYKRDEANSALWRVLELKTAPAGAYAPDWENIAPIRTYEYYGTGDDDGMPEQVKREIVPNIEGSDAQVTYYKYSEMVGGQLRKRNSPTVTKYQHLVNGVYEDYPVPMTMITSYDSMGRVLTTTDANSRTVQYNYDDLGRPTTTVYATGVQSENHYYDCCTMDWVADENGYKTYYDYDGLKRVTLMCTDIEGQDLLAYPLVEYTYDEFGNKHTVLTRSDGETARTTTYTYDANNRVSKIVYPYEQTEGDLIGTEEFGYDEVGRLLWKKGSDAKYTYYKYDSLGRTTDIYYDAGAPATPFVYPTGDGDVHYGYAIDQWGTDPGTSRYTSMTDASGTSWYWYDEQGRLARYVPPGHDKDEYVVAFGYNNLGQKVSVQIATPDDQDPNATLYDPYIWYGVLRLKDVVYSVGYEYYANGLLKKVTSGGSDIATYTYDVAGNRTDVDYGNGTHIDYEFDSDPRYRTVSITHKYGANVLAAISYPTRDNVGNPTSMSDWTGTWTYGYDANNRLDEALAPNLVTSGDPARAVPGQPAGGDYVYDWVGNRIRPPQGTGNEMVYNKADQLTRWPGMHGDATHPGYTYDSAGNLIAVKDASGTNTVASYTYTDAGLLSTASYNGRTLTNTWDGDSNRVGMNANGTAYTFVYDTTAGIPAVIEESSGGTTVYYIREPGGELIARVHPSQGIRYYHFDELGSTRLLTDGSGTVTDRYAYDAYGSLLAHDCYPGSVNQPYQYVGRLGYYTHWMEPEFGLLQLGVRFYDPEMGRFTQQDAFRGAAASAFVYANVRPTQDTDPTGLYVPGEGCDADCQKTLKPYVDQLSSLLSKPRCQQALASQGIADCVKANLAGITVKCTLKSITCGGETDPDPPYAINVNRNTVTAHVLLHEAVHSCRFKKGLWMTDEEVERKLGVKRMGQFQCPKCGAGPWTADDTNALWEEVRAEAIVHECGLR